MATIVERKDTHERFVLIGTGFGMAHASQPGVIFGSLLPDEKESEETMLCIADRDGEIAWVPSDRMRVIEIDGKSPGEFKVASFPGSDDRSGQMVRCERCSRIITTPVCPYCA